LVARTECYGGGLGAAVNFGCDPRHSICDCGWQVAGTQISYRRAGRRSSGSFVLPGSCCAPRREITALQKKRAAHQALAQARPTSALPFATTAERTHWQPSGPPDVPHRWPRPLVDIPSGICAGTRDFKPWFVQSGHRTAVVARNTTAAASDHRATDCLRKSYGSKLDCHHHQKCLSWGMIGTS
jgi:hypothetical protein